MMKFNVLSLMSLNLACGIAQDMIPEIKPDSFQKKGARSANLRPTFIKLEEPSIIKRESEAKKASSSQCQNIEEQQFSTKIEEGQEGAFQGQSQNAYPMEIENPLSIDPQERQQGLPPFLQYAQEVFQIKEEMPVKKEGPESKEKPLNK
jgi:hypothetical protein